MPPPPALPPPSLSMNPDPVSFSTTATTSSSASASASGQQKPATPAVATRSRASLVDVDLSFAALDASSPVYPGLRACDRCRERKVRCDRKSPRCTICIKRDEVCITTPLLPHQRGAKPLPAPELEPYAYGYETFPSPQPQPHTQPQLHRAAEPVASTSEWPPSGAAAAGSTSSSTAQKRARTRTESSSPPGVAMGPSDDAAVASWAGRTRRYAGPGSAAAAAAVKVDDDESSSRMMPTTSSNSPLALGRDAGGARRGSKRRLARNRGGATDTGGTETRSPSGSVLAVADPSPPTSSIRPRTHHPYQRRASTPSKKPLDADSEGASSPARALATVGGGDYSPASHYSVASSTGTTATAGGIDVPPRIYAPALMITAVEREDDEDGGHSGRADANRNGTGTGFGNGRRWTGLGTGNGVGARGGGVEQKQKQMKETRRALSRVLVEGREAPFERIRLDGIDLDRLVSQVELCDAVYAAPPPPPPPPPASASTSSSTSTLARNATLLTTTTDRSAAPPSATRAPLFSTNRTAPAPELWQHGPNAHQAHMCISTYFSRLEPALELFLPGPTVAHRFLQECNALWTAEATVRTRGQGQEEEGEEGVQQDKNVNVEVNGGATKGWTSVYLASMAMGAMAMTEVEWTSIGCPEDKTRAGAAWLEEAGRRLVEDGFARKPTLETVRASLLIVQSCLIGLNGPPDIPLVLESLPMITAAAFELGLHVELAPLSKLNGEAARAPMGGEGEGENDADERRALWWRLVELQVCWTPLLDRQLSLDPASFSTLPPPTISPSPLPMPLSPSSVREGKRKGDDDVTGSREDPVLPYEEQQQDAQHAQHVAATQALASLHAVLDFSCRAYHAATAPRPLRPRELDKLSQRLMDLVESQSAPLEAYTHGAAAATPTLSVPGAGGAALAERNDAARSLADLLLDVEVCRMQAVADEVGGPEDPELEELWNVHAGRLVSANPLAGPQVSHTLAITIYLNGLVLIALRLRDRVPALQGPDSAVREGMSSALESLRTAPWPLPLHQIIQRGIAVLESVTAGSRAPDVSHAA